MYLGIDLVSIVINCSYAELHGLQLRRHT